MQQSDRLCDLGVNLDRELNSSHHINETCLKAMLAILFIGRLRKYLTNDPDRLKMMVNAFVMFLSVRIKKFCIFEFDENENVFQTLNFQQP